MSDDYSHGQRDGLRLALAILAAEEAKWAALLGESRSYRTNATREVRHKTLQVAQQRLRTALKRLTLKSADAAAESETHRRAGRLGIVDFRAAREATSADQALRRLRSALHLAEEVAARLGAGEVLLGSMPDARPP